MKKKIGLNRKFKFNKWIPINQKSNVGGFIYYYNYSEYNIVEYLKKTLFGTSSKVWRQSGGKIVPEVWRQRL